MWTEDLTVSDWKSFVANYKTIYIKRPEALGYSSVALNIKRESLGLKKRELARDSQYILHAMLRYLVDAAFPAIKDSSVVNGHLPKGV